METNIVLVRHGETAWNREDRFRGRTDLNLTERGEAQAGRAAEKLTAWPISAIYSSPLRRAWATAAIIAEPVGLPVLTLEGVIDVDYGAWQGLTPQEAQERYGELYDQWLHHPLLFRFPGGESLEEVRGRAEAAVAEVVHRHPDEWVAVVSHRVVCKALLCVVLGLDTSHFWQVEQDVCAINHFTWKAGRWIVHLINDTCHWEGGRL
ncbi:MAG: histidine phosphatase family protein [Chloroflexi bacterium]|nr:histidine phosphatase family protein [Chloroflexota bacterium]